MAIFGAPQPRADHCEMAVRAALEMVSLIDLFSQEQAALGKVQIRIGVGVASGQVIAGYTGTQHRATYTCVGDTVNLAARLEAHTKVVGQPILIDDNTQRALNGRIQTEDQGPVQVKGKTVSVQVYSVPTGQPV
jgi:class 3 adenylate cyclase